MNDFVFHSPTKFVFGRGAADAVGGELSARGLRRALVVYGGGSAERSGVLGRVRASLDAAGVAHDELGGVRPNPEVAKVREGIGLVRSSACDCLLAVGGGSVIDCAKAIAFGAGYDGDVWDFFDGKAKIASCLPVAAVLTLPAAGSEGSASCVISNDSVGAKRGVGGDLIRPVLAFMDPESTFSLPPYQTAAGVTDMTAHICERYFSGQPAAPVTDALAAALVRTLLDAAPKALANPRDYEARAAIMWAGTLAHNDLVGCGRSASVKTRAGGWESHALEHELSALDPKIAHGAGLAVVMPAWMRHVWRADPSRFVLFGRDVFGIVPDDDSPAAVESAALAAIDRLQSFFVSLGMPRSLAEFGLESSCIDKLLAGLEKSKGRTFGAFMQLGPEDARAIYEDAFRTV
ncbi:MAG: iron-containing alcohol dehydrogenase [Kiritimatiellae bacterium]|nr:iron-containing alcohol dehydrogenase [Kiritimatiellia bacterium]